jgi:hypothetical protein
VSGDLPAVLIADPQGPLAELVRGIATLEAAHLPRHALVGGVAVMVRLSQAHRATQDLDEVVEPSSPSAAVLIGGEGSPDHRVVTPAGSASISSPSGTGRSACCPSRSFPTTTENGSCCSRTTTLRSAQPASVKVLTPDGGVLIETATPVATAAALFATKLQPAPNRSGLALVKRGSDMYDAFLLLDQLGPQAVGDGLRHGPHDLAPLVAALAGRLLDEHAERSMRWAADAGLGHPATGMTAAALRALGADLVPLLADRQRRRPQPRRPAGPAAEVPRLPPDGVGLLATWTYARAARRQRFRGCRPMASAAPTVDLCRSPRQPAGPDESAAPRARLRAVVGEPRPGHPAAACLPSGARHAHRSHGPATPRAARLRDDVTVSAAAEEAE